MPEAVSVSVDSLDTEQLIAAAYRTGKLAWKLRPHQRKVYDLYRAFEQRVIAGQNDGPPIFVLDCARRWGKTFLAIIIKGEDAQRRPRSIHTLATAFLADIGEIVIPMFEDIYEDCPDDCRPVLKTSHKGQNLGFYFPNGSSIKLVGVDKKPKGLRGRRSDGHAWTEAGFFDALVRPVSRVLHQFQKVQHACMFMESSAPEDPEHDFDEVFVPDAKRRNAYVFQTIDDNLDLTEEQKKKYFDEAAVVSIEEAKRELYGKRSRDLGGIVIPEFDPLKHVREMPLPEHARCITSDDPGMKHLNGLLLGYYDFERAMIVIQESWAGLNAGGPKLAAVIAAREYSLWGTWPHPKMSRIPLESTELAQGWKDLLRNDKYEHLAEKLYEMAQVKAEDRPDYEGFPGKWITQDIPDHYTYWNGTEHKKNPAARVSDIDYQLITSMSDHYGVEFEAVNKAELHAMVNSTRSWISQGRLVFAPGCGQVVDHFRAGKWDKQRQKFAEHRSFGHVDLLAAGIYLVRHVERYIADACSPNPPADIKLGLKPGADVQSRLPWVEKPAHELELERRLNSLQSTQRSRLRGTGSRMKSYRD